MKKLLLLLTIFSATSMASFAQWTTLASDGTGDGSHGGPGFLDGTKLEYRYDDKSDSVWFRVTVTNMLNANYGINIIMNVNGAGSTANWFGSNTSFKYNRIITAWITSGTSGTVGITDAAGFGAGNYTKLGKDNISISMDATAKTYTLGLKRTDIYNDTVLNATVIAGVGSNQFWDDDVPNSGSGSVNLKPAPSTGLHSVNLNDDSFIIYPNPTSGTININRVTAENTASVYVYNSIGQQVYSNEIKKGNQKHAIDLSSQSAGLYFISVKNGGNNLTQSVMLK